jgi:hypothetical protein
VSEFGSIIPEAQKFRRPPGWFGDRRQMSQKLVELAGYRVQQWHRLPDIGNEPM